MCLCIVQAMMCDDFYLTTGWVLIKKDQEQELDPLAIAGFIALIGLFANELITATQDERSRIANELRDYLKRNRPPRSEFMIPAYTAGILNYVSQLISGWSSNVLAQTIPITEARLASLYQATTDAWAAVNVGGFMPGLLQSEQRLMQGIITNQNRFVSNAFGPAILNDIQSAIESSLENLDVRLGNMIESSASYFPVYASNAMTLTRGIAATNQFVRGGFQQAEYSNPLDERTTDFCWMIAGKRFNLYDAQAQAQRMASSSSMDEFRRSAPYVTRTSEGFELNGITLNAENAASVLADSDALLPPFHPRCRTLIIPV